MYVYTLYIIVYENILTFLKIGIHHGSGLPFQVPGSGLNGAQAAPV